MVMPTYFTVCARNYLAYAFTLAQSHRVVAGDNPFVIFVVDGLEGVEVESSQSIEIIDAASLDIATFRSMTLRYSIVELSTAIKPSCFLHLFDRGAASAVYLDPDILIYRKLDHVEQLLEGGAELVLTPHRIAPLQVTGRPSEIDLLLTGAYNLGFAAARDTRDSRAFLAWWRDRLATECRIALSEGVFVDQKWMDLAPSYLAGTSILRHPGYNAAYWNLDHRPLTHEASGWFACGERLHFFHFSGVEPSDRNVFSKYQDRFRPKDLGAFQAELDRYLTMLWDNGHARWSKIAYRFALPGVFGRLEPQVRSIMRAELDLNAGPEAMNSQEILDLCGAPSAAPGLSRLAYEVWRSRPDLQRVYDVSTGRGRRGYAEWLGARASKEYGVEPSLFSEVRGAPFSRALVRSLKARLKRLVGRLR